MSCFLSSFFTENTWPVNRLFTLCFPQVSGLNSTHSIIFNGQISCQRRQLPETVSCELSMSSHGESSGTLVSDNVLYLFQWFFITVVCNIIDVFGVMTNIINIICFLRLGFRDPVNISLLGKERPLYCLKT